MTYSGGGWRRTALGLSILTSLVVLLLRPASAEDSKPQVERVRQIYLEGTSPSGGEITAVMSDAGVAPSARSSFLTIT